MRQFPLEPLIMKSSCNGVFIRISFPCMPSLYSFASVSSPRFKFFSFTMMDVLLAYFVKGLRLPNLYIACISLVFCAHERLQEKTSPSILGQKLHNVQKDFFQSFNFS